MVGTLILIKNPIFDPKSHRIERRKLDMRRRVPKLDHLSIQLALHQFALNLSPFRPEPKRIKYNLSDSHQQKIKFIPVISKNTPTA